MPQLHIESKLKLRCCILWGDYSVMII
jgi:hypothetical protein